MPRTLRALVLAAAVALVTVVALPPAPLRAVTPSDASGAYAAFERTYWDPASRTFFAWSDHRPLLGRTATGLWFTAQLWETVMDVYELEPSPALRTRIDDVYDGALVVFPGLHSDFNDDRGWWALAAARAYRLTGERRFLDTSVAISDATWTAWDGTFGGGLWWRNSIHNQKNMATNAPAAMTAARLYAITGQARFRDRALALFGWLDRTLRSGDRLSDRVEVRGSGASQRIDDQYTYNYGTYVGAALELARLTNDTSYLRRAESAADNGISILAPSGILPDEGGGDGGAFKGILVRNLADLARADGRDSYAAFLAANAASAWSHRRADGIVGSSWTATAGSSHVESGTAASALDVIVLAERLAPMIAPSPTRGRSSAPAEVAMPAAAAANLAGSAGNATPPATDGTPPAFPVASAFGFGLAVLACAALLVRRAGQRQA